MYVKYFDTIVEQVDYGFLCICKELEDAENVKTYKI